MEEKDKMVIGLQSLPLEKLDHVAHVLMKRNLNLQQEQDEIEFDIDIYTLDTETLWELGRFVEKIETNNNASSSSSNA
ncbi:hypothetical protein LWI28_026776 [Acer negundo]|uniref:NET domain-containing protein n=1 Tax=Acer negundo TaxID=4023 RepID=A0AAD5NKK7_ACENE|nr:hypothetical protein LWI28_026776 [Acer negundo]KAK4839572.1 hypothetical protein QYF36_022884 [Acer negundo]